MLLGEKAVLGVPPVPKLVDGRRVLEFPRQKFDPQRGDIVAFKIKKALFRGEFDYFDDDCQVWRLVAVRQIG